MNITNIELQNTGGNCMVLYVEVEGLNYVRTIGLNDECICLFDCTLQDVNEGERESDYIEMSVGNPFNDLGDIIGKRNATKIKEIYLNRY
jgi:hypothetical protein